MKSKLFALVFLAGSVAFAGPRIFVGVGFGAPAPVAVYAPPPVPVVAPYAPVALGPGYAARWNWHPAYWAPRPYAHANWIAPRYNAGRYYGGYWRR